MTQDEQDITAMLAAWNDGDADALGRLVDLVYPELRRIARQHLEQRRAGDSLESAAVANEAYLKLARAGGIHCESRTHFLALCAQIIRRILVDHARRRGYAKRGGNAARVTLDDALLGAPARGIDLLALDQALESLSKIDERKGRVVELRYFAELPDEQIATILNISTRTVQRDWLLAKDWLAEKVR